SRSLKEICKDIEIVISKKNFPYKFRSTDFISTIGILNEFLELRKLVKKYVDDFDIINFHNFPANWVGFNINKPVVWYCNEVPDLVNNPHPSLLLRLLRFLGIIIDKYVVRNYIDRICVADEINANIVRKRYGLESKIIPYGINSDIYAPKLIHNRSEFLKKYKIEIPDKDLILIQVGVISPQKNQIESVKVLKKLRDYGYKANLIFVGKNDVPYKNIIDNLIFEYKLENNVFYTGMLSKLETVNFYNIADVGLYPIKEQGGWLAPFEMMLCGKPVIVSSTMGSSSLIKKHDFAMVSNDFCSDIIKFMTNYEVYKNKAQVSSIWIKEKLTWENFAKNMLDVMKEAIINFKRG
ncbi:MAG: glycosyltransferase family 4 protein, partial [Endomicrobiia bacterium]